MFFQQGKSRYCGFSGLDFLHFWLQSVYAYATNAPNPSDKNKQTHRTPPVFVVGTHRDTLDHDNMVSIQQTVNADRFVAISCEHVKPVVW